jgi:hypothetical protein
MQLHDEIPDIMFLTVANRDLYAKLIDFNEEFYYQPYHHSDCRLRIGVDACSLISERLFIQWQVYRPDSYTQLFDWGAGAKLFLSPHATVSELAQTIFGLIQAYETHEVREAFVWRRRRVYGPHVSLDAHWEAAEHTVTRAVRETP